MLDSTRRTRLTALAVGVALAIAACGGGQPAGDDRVPAEPTTTTAPGGVRGMIGQVDRANDVADQLNARNDLLENQAP